MDFRVRWGGDAHPHNLNYGPTVIYVRFSYSSFQ